MSRAEQAGSVPSQSAVADRRRHAALPGAALSRSARAVYAACGVLLVGYLISEIARPGGQSWPWLDGWGVAGFEVLLSLLCLARGLVQRRGRAATIVIGLALLMWALGDFALTAESAGGATPPTPSLADAFYLAFYPLTYIGVMLLVRRQVKRLIKATWLDGAVVGFGAAAVCAEFAFHRVAAAAGGGAAEVATNLAYPVGDLLLLVLIGGATAVLPNRRQARWVLLAVGYLLNAGGDTVNLFHTTLESTQLGTMLDAVAWPASTLLISASMWLPRPRPAAGSRERPSGLALPAVAATGALVILLLAAWHHGSHVAVALAAATLLLAGLRASLSLLQLRSLTKERHAQAITDDLTQLGNRRALFELLEDLLVEPESVDEPERSIAFLFVDLNRFKEINDSFGHAVGDELLRQLGRRLGGALRAGDLLVRLGGDEFAVVLMDADADYGATIAERLAARLSEPFALGEVNAQIGASIGIAVAPGDATDAEELVRRADLAMYRAKVEGKHYAIYQTGIDGQGSRLELVEDLRLAIEARAIALHYQPQIDLVTGELVALEALARWRHPELGDIPPLEFLPLAEDAQLMDALTATLLEQALRQCAAWRAEGQRFSIGVNISTTNLLDPGFPALVERLLRRHRVPAESLVIEITETTAMADFERCKAAIHELSELGVTVSVDDFGAGFTSLAHLSSLAVGELKLDRSFISGLANRSEPRDVALVRSTIDLAHSLGLRVVGEGVEDAATLELLAELGCDLAQGYLISRPLPAHELVLEPAADAPGSTPQREPEAA